MLEINKTDPEMSLCKFTRAYVKAHHKSKDRTEDRK